MTKDEMFEALHLAFTGKSGKKNDKLARFQELPPKEAAEEARVYLAWAVRRQDKASSDLMYWAYEGDKTLAKVMVAVFSAIDAGVEEFPPLPKTEGRVLMDKTGLLQDWADSLAVKEGR